MGQAQRRQAAGRDLVDAEAAEDCEPLPVETARAKAGTAQVAHDARTQPGRSPLRVAQGGRQRLPRVQGVGCQPSGGRAIAERDEQGKAVQPLAVEIAEGGGEQIGRGTARRGERGRDRLLQSSGAVA